jgi:hypothetical protein
MIKIVQVWFTASVLIGALIYLWSMVNGKERWQLTKIVLIAILCGLISAMFLSLIYILF